MRSRTALWSGLLVLGTVLIWLFSRPSPQAGGRSGAEQNSPVQPSATRSAPAAPLVGGEQLEKESRDTISPPPSNPSPGAAAAAAIPNAPMDAAPERVRSAAQLDSALDEVRLMIRDYHTALGENPVGTNAEIMQAINGHNAKQAKIGPPPGQSVNEKGELVDQWGTPYFFHQISGTEMEIRSAGPDRVMWTPDDRQVK